MVQNPEVSKFTPEEEEFMVVLSIFGALQMVDLLTTALIILNGGYEMNFILLAITDLLPGSFLEDFLWIKFLFMLLSLTIFVILYSAYPKSRHVIEIIVMIGLAFSAIVIFNNLVVLYKMGVLIWFFV